MVYDRLNSGTSFKILAENQMRHNKIVGWERFLGVRRSRSKGQSLALASDRQAGLGMAVLVFGRANQGVERDQSVGCRCRQSFRNSVEGEICHGHLFLAAELALRFVLLRYRQEFPFRYRITSSRA